uniref:Cadherin domain-containing protein n=1 Tax=Cacopsylla melanoneura TaxID=428564 RepID=A0A8D8LY42_9HEMI
MQGIQFWTHVFLWSTLIFGFDPVSGIRPRPNEQTDYNSANSRSSAQPMRNRRKNQPNIGGNFPIGYNLPNIGGKFPIGHDILGQKINDPTNHQQNQTKRELWFKICGWFSSVKENQPGGTAITTVSAGYLDPTRTGYFDLQMNNDIKYRIQDTTNDGRYSRTKVPNISQISPNPNNTTDNKNHLYFSIDPNSGQITTRIPIHRKDLQDKNEIKLTVIAEDSRNPHISRATCTIRILIEDTNDSIDNQPKKSSKEGVHDHRAISETVNSEPQKSRGIDQITNELNSEGQPDLPSKPESPETEKSVVKTMESQGADQFINKSNRGGLTDPPLKPESPET